MAGTSPITKFFVHWLLRRKTRERRHDASLKHPRFAELAGMLRDGRRSEFLGAFAALRTDERHVILNGLAEQSSLDEFRPWAQERCPTGLLLHGASLITHAWRARTGLAGKYVTAEGATRFFEHLNDAFDALLEAHTAQPDDPEPVARLIRALMGLEAGHGEIYECYERLLATGRQHLVGGYQAIEALGPKWGGSEQAAMAFAHTHANADPRNRSLIAYAHIENWVFATQTPGAANAYFARPHVREEIMQAYLGDPLRQASDDYFALIAHSAYAMCFYMLEDKARTRDELSVVADRYPSKPWVYLRAVESTAVNAARAWSGLPENAD